jgi:hypothetical protein
MEGTGSPAGKSRSSAIGMRRRGEQVRFHVGRVCSLGVRYFVLPVLDPAERHQVRVRQRCGAWRYRELMGSALVMPRARQRAAAALCPARQGRGLAGAARLRVARASGGRLADRRRAPGRTAGPHLPGSERLPHHVPRVDRRRRSAMAAHSTCSSLSPRRIPAASAPIGRRSPFGTASRGNPYRHT